jgi:hypothetical protein
MKPVSLAVFTVVLYVGTPLLAAAQAGAASTPRASTAAARTRPDSSPLAPERANFRLMMTSAVPRNVVSAAEAMPADRYGFAPPDFCGRRCASEADVSMMKRSSSDSR